MPARLLLVEVTEYAWVLLVEVSEYARVLLVVVVGPCLISTRERLLLGVSVCRLFLLVHMFL